MNGILRLLPLLVIACYGAKCNPCDGEVFSLACKMFEVLQENTDTREQALEKQFDGLAIHESNDTARTRMLIVEDVDTLSLKLDNDINLVKKVTLEKLMVLKDLAEVKIKETIRSKIDEALEKLNEEILQLKVNLTLKVDSSTAFYSHGLKDLESATRWSLKTSENSQEIAFSVIKKYINENDERLESTIVNLINEGPKIAEKFDNNTVKYKKGLSELMENLKAYKASWQEDLKKDISSLNKEMDEKQTNLEKELKKSITDSAAQLKKSMAKKLRLKYKSLENEANNIVTNVSPELKKTIKSKIYKKYIRMRKDMTAQIANSVNDEFGAINKIIWEIWETISSEGQVWPEGHYCVYGKVGCPVGFVTRSGNSNWKFCCK